MASGGGGCSASERLPPPFPGLEPESEGAAGGSEPEAGDSDTEGEDIFTGAAAAAVSSLLLGRPGGGRVPQKGRKSQRGSGRLGRVGTARPCVGDSNRGLGLLDERRDVGPGFPAPGADSGK